MGGLGLNECLEDFWAKKTKNAFFFLEKKDCRLGGEKIEINYFLPHFVEKCLFQSHFWKNAKMGVFLRHQRCPLF